MYALVALLFAQPAPALTLPPSVQGGVGKIIVISVETPGKVVKFVPLDKGLDFADSKLLSSTKIAIVTAAVPGKYRVMAYSAVGDQPTDPATCVVEVTGAKPDDVQPEPSDLRKEVADLYRGISDDSKRDGALKLASTARAFAATPPRAQTVGGYFLDLKAALDQSALPASIKPLRERLGRALSATLGSSVSAALTPDAVAQAAGALNAFADALTEAAQ